jgi:hypothetical protein
MPNSGLLALQRGVAQYFEDQSVAAQVLIGLKARGLWAKSRVVIIPGKFDGSEAPRPMAAGKFGPPTKKESFNPREVAEWVRELTLSIFAVDPENLQSEEAQIIALENLIESTLQGVWNAMDPVSGKNVGGPGIEWGDSFYVVPPVQLAYGRELLLGCTMKNPMFDLPQAVRHPTAGPFTKKFSAPLHP